MQIETNELTGPALDWAAAKCEKYPMGIWYDEDELPMIRDDIVPEWRPSTDWAQGGPIIEREGITVQRVTGALWDAYCQRVHRADGPTPLVAAMRCYVASKLGHTIEVPEGL